MQFDLQKAIARRTDAQSEDRADRALEATKGKLMTTATSIYGSRPSISKHESQFADDDNAFTGPTHSKFVGLRKIALLRWRQSGVLMAVLTTSRNFVLKIGNIDRH